MCVCARTGPSLQADRGNIRRKNPPFFHPAFRRPASAPRRRFQFELLFGLAVRLEATTLLWRARRRLGKGFRKRSKKQNFECCLFPPSHLASRYLLKDTGLTMLHCLVLTNSLQAVQEYMYVQPSDFDYPIQIGIFLFSNQPSFQPSTILAMSKSYPEYAIAALSSMTSIMAPSFDISGLLLQVRFCDRIYPFTEIFISHS